MDDEHVSHLVRDIELNGLQDFNFPMSVVDHGAAYLASGRSKRYEIVNGYHRYHACRRLEIPRFCSNVFLAGGLGIEQRLLLTLNTKGHSKESSWGHIFNSLVASFADFENATLKQVSDRLGVLLNKSTKTEHWANKYWNIVKFPEIKLTTDYRYYQADKVAYKF